MPCSKRRDCCGPGLGARVGYPQSDEGSAASAGTVPALPKAFPDVTPYPAAQSQDASLVLGPPVVGPPAALILTPTVAQLRAAPRLPRVPFRSHLVFELRDGLGGDGDEQRDGEDEAQELAFPDSASAALFRVDLQPQFLRDPLADVAQRSPGRLLAAHVDVAVIGVSDVLEAAAFQFLVELIQVDVGQQRGERPTLRRAFYAADLAPVLAGPLLPGGTSR